MTSETINLSCLTNTPYSNVGGAEL